MAFLTTHQKRFLIISLALIFCLFQTAAAQSGRKKDKPPETPEQPSAVETTNDSQNKKQTEQISSLKIAGELQYDSGWTKSTYLGSVLEECADNFQGRPGEPLKVEKVGKMKLNDAKELAKKESDAYVLWMGFFVRNTTYGSYVDFVDYALLKPATGKVLTYGRIQPGRTSMGNTGTVLQVPINKKAPTELSQLKQGAREVATLLKRGGWFD